MTGITSGLSVVVSWLARPAESSTRRKSQVRFRHFSMGTTRICRHLRKWCSTTPPIFLHRDREPVADDYCCQLPLFLSPLGRLEAFRSKWNHLLNGANGAICSHAPEGGATWASDDRVEHRAIRRPRRQCLTPFVEAPGEDEKNVRTGLGEERPSVSAAGTDQTAFRRAGTRARRRKRPGRNGTICANGTMSFYGSIRGNATICANATKEASNTF